MSLGRGSAIGMSNNQKIDTRSSTELELVGADDVIPQLMWTMYFIEAHGCSMEECILNQDNMSAMLLETNTKQSSSKRTKHIRVRYFFIKDRVSNGDTTLKHCLMGEMMSDNFTKPLQGALFRKFRAEIQGIPVDIYEAELGWDREENIETIKKTYPSSQESVGLQGERYGSKDPGLSGRYILALQHKIRPAESVSKSDTKPAGCHKKSLHRSRSRSYAQAVKGARTGYSP
jgi:hypothetical protein